MGRNDNKSINLKRAEWLKPIHYRTNELEAVLGAGRTKIGEWIKDGRLQSYKIDGTVFVHADEVDRFVDRYRRGVGPDFAI